MRERRKELSNKNNLPRWSAAEKEKLRDMFYEGYSDKEIGEKLGRTALAVGIQRHYMKLPKAHQPSKEFVIHDAMVDYYPSWYKKQLREQWKKQQLTSTR